MKNILTVDLEDWHQSILTIEPEKWGKYEKRIEESTHRLLDILDQYKSKATFFILGQVAFDLDEKLQVVMVFRQLRKHAVEVFQFEDVVDQPETVAVILFR